jgi:hypothetical protein
MDLIRISGTALPAPTKYNVDFNDIDSASSGRNDQAIMVRDIIRRDVANIQLGWDLLTTTELETIINLLDDKMTVQFFNGTIKTATMYHGKISEEMKAYPDETYWSLSFDLIEY